VAREEVSPLLSSWFRLLRPRLQNLVRSGVLARLSPRQRAQAAVAVAASVLAVILAVVLVSTAAGGAPFTGSSAAGHESGAAGATADRNPGTAGAEARPADPVPDPLPTVSRLPKLSTAQMAGERVIYSYGGLTPPASLLQLIQHGEAAGVIFFSQNISSLPQITKVIAELEQANASPSNPVRAPLLLMTDQEGGLVRRMPGPPYISQRQIGESAAPAAAAASAGSNAAENLRGVGMNVNLAPVVDVYRTTGDFDDQNQRSYSTNPAVVSELGAAFINAQQNAGVAATAKHFPGLGAAAAGDDTDDEPVTLNVPLSTIRSVDELPYGAAIAAGVKLIMVSWAVYPALDPARPAGLSPTIVGGELRHRLGYKGVTITDALEAGALRSYGSYQNRAQLAAAAGMDLILCSVQNVTEGQQAAAGLQAGYQDGKLAKPTFTAALQRVIALRTSMAS
jgi:beta-N-acetylhexosaminidase